MDEQQLIDCHATRTANRKQKQILSGHALLDEKQFDQPKQGGGTENAKEHQDIWREVIGHDAFGNHVARAIQSIHCKESNVGAKNVAHTN